MRRSALFLLLPLLLLTLAACGDSQDDESNDPSGPVPAGGQPGMPAGPSSELNPPRVGEATSDMKLTDQMMEDYVALTRKLHKTGAQGPTDAMLAGYSIDMTRWLSIATLASRAAMASNAGQARKRTEETLAGLRKRLDGASAARREGLERAIAGLETQLDLIDKMPTASEQDRKNYEVLEKWMPKLRAAQEGR